MSYTYFVRFREILAIVAVVIPFAAGVFLLWFGFSDFLSPSGQTAPWGEKPWRPLARLAFSVVMLGILIAVSGILLKNASRRRS